MRDRGRALLNLGRTAAALLICVAAGALVSIAVARSNSSSLGAAYGYGYQYCTTPGQYQYCTTTTTTSTTSSTTTTTTSTTTTTTTTPSTTTSTTTTTTRKPPVQKVTICHRTGKKKKPYVRIRVAKSALPAHLRHGDILPGSAPCPTTLKKTDGKGHVLGASKARRGARPSRIGFAG